MASGVAGPSTGAATAAPGPGVGGKAGAAPAPTIAQPSATASIFGVSSPDPSIPSLDSEAGDEGIRDEGAVEGARELADQSVDDGLSDAEREVQAAAAEEAQVAEGNEPAPDGEEFEFGGQRFKTPQEAEQAFKTALGRLTKQGRDLSDTQAALKDALTFGHQWRQAAELARAGRPGVGTTPGAPANANPDAGPGNPPAPDSNEGLLAFADTMDWGRVQEIADEHGMGVALNFTLRKMLRAQQEHFGKQLSETVKPFQEFHSTIEEVRATQTVFQTLGELQDQAGAPVYPELNESNPLAATAAPHVVALYREIVARYPNLKGTEDGVHFAVLEYRRLHPGGAPAAGTTPTIPGRRTVPAKGSGVGAQVLRALRDASGPAAGAAAQTPNGRNAPPKRGPVTEADEFARDIATHKKRVNSLFGVAR